MLWFRIPLTWHGAVPAAVADELFGTPEKGATCSMCLRSECPSPVALHPSALTPHSPHRCRSMPDIQTLSTTFTKEVPFTRESADMHVHALSPE